MKFIKNINNNKYRIPASTFNNLCTRFYNLVFSSKYNNIEKEKIIWNLLYKYKNYILLYPHTTNKHFIDLYTIHDFNLWKNYKRI